MLLCEYSYHVALTYGISQSVYLSGLDDIKFEGVSLISSVDTKYAAVRKRHIASGLVKGLRRWTTSSVILS